MWLAGITEESYVDGPGIRTVLFTQGCPHGCLYCHNKDSWPLEGGREYSVRQMIRKIRKPGRGYRMLRGVTFSGGEPFLQALELAILAQEAHAMGLDVVTYTGYQYETLAASSDQNVQALLAESDLLIDGPYIHERRDIGLKFRGSTNQRVIDLPATRREGQVVLFD